MKKQAPNLRVYEVKKPHPPPPRLKSIPKQPQPEPKNIKKTKPAAMAHPPPPPQAKQQKPAPTATEIINSLQTMDIQHLNFQQCWQKMIAILDNNVVRMVALFPEPGNSVGEQLIKNGKFLIIWLKIIVKNAYLNIQMVYKNVREKYLPNIILEKQLLETYLSQKIIPQQSLTPAKPTQTQSLKRSILKSKTSLSQKRVQFGVNQIIYPVLNDYQPVDINKEDTRLNMVKGVRDKQGFLLDYFEINQVYFLDEVEIVGEIREYQQIYTILLVRVKDTNKEVLCIGMLKNQVVQYQQLTLLQKIERDYQNLAYLELEGKNPGQVWLNSLSTELPR